MSVTMLLISSGLTGGLMVEEGWRTFNFIRWHFALSALLLLLQDGEHSRGNNTSTSPDGHKSGNQQTFRILKNAPLPSPQTHSALVLYRSGVRVEFIIRLRSSVLRARSAITPPYLPTYIICISQNNINNNNNRKYVCWKLGDRRIRSRSGNWQA
jgi:hypothetical protein